MSGGVRIRGQLVEFNSERIAWENQPESVDDEDLKEMLEALIDGDFSSVRELSFVRSVFCIAVQSHDKIFVGHELIDGRHGRAHRPCFEDQQNSDAH